LRQNVAFFDHIGAGEISTYINANMNTIQDGISQKVGLTIAGLSTFVTALVIAFVKSWRLALVMLSAVVSIMLVMGGVGKFMKSQQDKAIQSTAAGSTLAEETVASMRTITALGAQGHFEKEYDSRMAENLKLEWKWRASLGILLALMMCIMSLQYGLAFWQGSRFFRDGEITVSSLLTTILASLAAGVSFGHIAPYLGSFSAAVGAASKIFELIERDSPIDSQSSSGQEPKSFDSQIAFRNLTHWYPSRPSGPPVLDNLNLIIPAGKVTAIVGASGSGKSTLISLIERFYMPTRGQILVDKYDIADLNLKWWRRQISLVGQEPVLFSGTIHENIEYGLVGTEYEQVSKSLYSVCPFSPSTCLINRQLIPKRWTKKLDTIS
jgi:ATP-binding cassette, subfamily B (MDR/TAP), member 1